MVSPLASHFGVLDYVGCRPFHLGVIVYGESPASHLEVLDYGESFFLPPRGARLR